jgi:hypothetical protein
MLAGLAPAGTKASLAARQTFVFCLAPTRSVSPPRRRPCIPSIRPSAAGGGRWRACRPSRSFAPRCRSGLPLSTRENGPCHTGRYTEGAGDFEHSHVAGMSQASREIMLGSGRDLKQPRAQAAINALREARRPAPGGRLCCQRPCEFTLSPIRCPARILPLAQRSASISRTIARTIARRIGLKAARDHGSAALLPAPQAARGTRWSTPAKVITTLLPTPCALASAHRASHQRRKGLSAITP